MSLQEPEQMIETMHGYDDQYEDLFNEFILDPQFDFTANAMGNPESMHLDGIEYSDPPLISNEQSIVAAYNEWGLAPGSLISPDMLTDDLINLPGSMGDAPAVDMILDLILTTFGETNTSRTPVAESLQQMSQMQNRF